MSEIKLCVLEDDKECTNCGKCLYCDLDMTKICDNCCKCLEQSNKDYETIFIDEIIE